MREKFLEKNYPDNTIKQAISKAKAINRSELLKQEQTKVQNQTIPFVTNYNGKTKNISKILTNRKYILNRLPETMNLAKYKYTVAYSRNVILRNMLVKSDIKPKYGKIGSKPCGLNCYLCRRMIRTETLKSHANNYQLKMRDDISCTTNNFVYMIVCRICHLQYVLQTGNTLKERFRGHFQDVNTENKYKPISIHFTLPRHNKHDVTITGIGKTPTDVNIRLRTEEACISTLSTAEPWDLTKLLQGKEQ
ncbi:unnamed protein product [Mytilus coruscus]|uniref:GIY-YIG domain-containing protein n=1 Tax=Mytilus coruscus TaxID=42192 RepID=A0A6J8AIZ8_MYTCO|nr:unnamed protein product [Mytilus coruscus]